MVLKEANGAIQGVHLSAIQTFATPDASYPGFNALTMTRGATQPSPMDMPQGYAKKNDQYPIQSAGTMRDDESGGQSFRQFKPGDKIPLSELQQRDPALAKQWKHSDQKRRQRDLSSALTDELNLLIGSIRSEQRMEDEMMLRPQGHIIEFQPSFNFAFIDAIADGERCFFNKGDIVDNAIREEPGTQIPVLFVRTKNSKGNAAKCVHRVMSIMDAIELSGRIFGSGDVYRAMQLLSNVKEQAPDNQSVDRVLTLIGRVKEDEDYRGGKYKERYDYRRDEVIEMAKEAKLSKDYERAIELYQDALDRGVSTELCIKEIMQLYTSLHNMAYDTDDKAEIKERAVEFIRRYRDALPPKTGALGVLENVLYAFGLYDEHIDVVEDLISMCERKGDRSRYTFYLNKAAMSYLHLGEPEQALDACRQGLQEEPGNPHLLKTLQAITEASDKGVNDL